MNQKIETCCSEAPACCDMRGMLSFHILWLLSKDSLNGQEIAEELEKRRGTKPTPGTIYPALKDLRIKGMVTMEKKGRTTTYSLSKEGTIGLKEACTYFCNVFGEIFQEQKEKQSNRQNLKNSHKEFKVHDS